MKEINKYQTEIEDQITSYAFRYPLEKIRKYSQLVDLNSFKMLNEIDKKIINVRNRITLLAKSIEINDLDKVLKKGFTLIKQNLKFIPRKKNFDLQSPAIVKFYDGEIEIK